MGFVYFVTKHCNILRQSTIFVLKLLHSKFKCSVGNICVKSNYTFEFKKICNVWSMSVLICSSWHSSKNLFHHYRLFILMIVDNAISNIEFVFFFCQRFTTGLVVLNIITIGPFIMKVVKVYFFSRVEIFFKNLHSVRAAWWFQNSGWSA